MLPLTIWSSLCIDYQQDLLHNGITVPHGVEHSSGETGVFWGHPVLQILHQLTQTHRCVRVSSHVYVSAWIRVRVVYFWEARASIILSNLICSLLVTYWKAVIHFFIYIFLFSGGGKPCGARRLISQTCAALSAALIPLMSSKPQSPQGCLG
jgi:hypothetical protein